MVRTEKAYEDLRQESERKMWKVYMDMMKASGGCEQGQSTRGEKLAATTDWTAD